MSKPALPTDVIDVRGLQVTSLPLTTLEAAVRGGGPKLFDSALQRRVDLPALWAAQMRNNTALSAVFNTRITGCGGGGRPPGGRA